MHTRVCMQAIYQARLHLHFVLTVRHAEDTRGLSWWTSVHRDSDWRYGVLWWREYVSFSPPFQLQRSLVWGVATSLAADFISTWWPGLVDHRVCSGQVGPSLDANLPPCCCSCGEEEESSYEWTWCTVIMHPCSYAWWLAIVSLCMYAVFFYGLLNLRFAITTWYIKSLYILCTRAMYNPGWPRCLQNWREYKWMRTFHWCTWPWRPTSWRAKFEV